MKVLDIGCGWGGMALYLQPEVADVDVLGITLSEEQLKVARRRAEPRRASPIKRQVRADRLSRRSPAGYDRIVSVGMFEHVGPCPISEPIFRQCRELLTDDGVALLLHTIGRMGRARAIPTDFTAKYIFPGRLQSPR